MYPLVVAAALVLFSVLPATAQTLEKPVARKFHPHVTTAARTVEPEKLTFESFPGANGLAPFLYNNLALGLSDSIEVGIVPAFFLLGKAHRYNINTKINLLNDKNFQFSLGVSHFALRPVDEDGKVVDVLIEEDGSRTQQPYVAWNFISAMGNFFISDSPFSVGLMATHVVMDTNSPGIQSYMNLRTVLPEWAADVSFALSQDYFLTGGIGEQRIELFNIFESARPFGFGLSLTGLADRNWFPRWRVGVHLMPQYSKPWQILASFDI